MKALWIRVEAHELRSVRMRDFAARLGVSRAAALGHFVALGGNIAEQLEDGNIAQVADDVLADWGGWTGKTDKFADAVRSILQGPDGDFANWSESMGKLVQRRAIDRQRKTPKAQDSVETPRKFRGKSVESDSGFRGISVATERNGTERKDGESSAVGEIESKRAFNTSARDSKSADTAAPLRSLALAQLLEELHPELRAFHRRLYHGRSPDRQRDVAWTLVQLQRGNAVWDHHGQPVRAYSLDRLLTRAIDTINGPLRDLDKGIVVLLTKLGDTSDLAGSGALPGQVEAKALAPDGPLDERVEALLAGVAAALPTLTKTSSE